MEAEEQVEAAKATAGGGRGGGGPGGPGTLTSVEKATCRRIARRFLMRAVGSLWMPSHTPLMNTWGGRMHDGTNTPRDMRKEDAGEETFSRSESTLASLMLVQAPP